MYLLDRAQWAVSAFWMDDLKAKGLKIDLPHSQCVMMRFLFEKDGLSQKEIATMLRKDVSAVKRTVDNLEKKGLVIRKPVTGCKYGICLTPAGRALKDDVTEVADRVLKETFGLSEEERRIGIKFLEAISRSYVQGRVGRAPDIAFDEDKKFDESFMDDRM